MAGIQKSILDINAAVTPHLIIVDGIVGMEGDVVTMQDIFIFDRTRVGEGGAVIGEFRATGIRPKFADRLKRYGIPLPQQMFSITPEQRAGAAW